MPVILLLVVAIDTASARSSELYAGACATDFCHMTSPRQHIMSMRIIWQNGVSDTPIVVYTPTIT